MSIRRGSNFHLKGFRLRIYRGFDYIEWVGSIFKKCKKKRMKDTESNILKDKANSKSEDEQVANVRILTLARDAFF